MSYISFIVHEKNEDDVIKFCNHHKTTLANARIIATKSEKNKIENVLGEDGITIISSLENKGDEFISSKVTKGELSAVFYFMPPTEHLSGLIDLVQACNKRKVYLGLDFHTSNGIIQRLLTEKKIRDDGVPISKKEGNFANTSKTKYTRSHIDYKEAKMRNVDWSNQQLLTFLSLNNYDHLKSIYFDTAPVEQGSRLHIFTKHETLNNCLRVKSGNVEDLVDILCMSDNDPLCDLYEHDKFVRDWFLTFHSFSSPKEFFVYWRLRFLKCFEGADDEETKISNIEACLRIFKIWLQTDFAADFVLDKNLMKDLHTLIDEEIVEKMKTFKDTTDMTDFSLDLKTTLDRYIDLFENRPKPDLSNAPPSILPKRNKESTELGTILDVDPLELARQITIMESEKYQNLRAKEFVRTAWTRKNAHEIAPNLTQYIELSNRISHWMVTEVLKQKSFDDMTELLIKFIKIGKHLLNFKNYSGLMEVITALNSPAISRLKQCWSDIPVKLKDTLDSLTEAVSPLGHYKNYRSAFTSIGSETPCLPILPATLSDLNGYEEVFSNMTNEGLVNWTKMAKIADRIWEAISVNAYYELRPVPMIQDYILNSSIWSDGLTTCAIVDLKISEINKEQDKKDEKRHSKRRSTTGVGSLLINEQEGDKDDLSEKDWEYLLKGVEKPNSYSDGDVILSSGSANDKLYRIRSGTVNVVKEVNGQDTVIATMTDNAMFGEISMLLRSQKGTATASIVAQGDVEIWELEIEFLLTLLKSEPFLAEKLNRILAIKLARRLRDLGKKQPIQKTDSKKGVKVEKKEEEKAEKVVEKKKADPIEKMATAIGIEMKSIIKHEACSLKTTQATRSGTVFITRNNICFYTKYFGSKYVNDTPYTSITDIKKDTKHLIIHRADEEPLMFFDFEDKNVVFTLIKSLWSHHANSNPSKKEKKKSDRRIKEGDTKSEWLPSEEDWNMILKGARTVTYKKDDAIMKEGDQFRRVFQLLRGECRFEKLIDGQNKILGKMNKDGGDALFGEISFLEGGKASASVVCDQDDTQVAIIEGYFLETLFQYYPEIAGRFYHYISNVLSKRLKQRESSSLSSSNSSGDLKKKKKKKE